MVNILAVREPELHAGVSFYGVAPPLETVPRIKAPLISLVLPVYNGARYLPLALDSIFAQSFTDFELIISDNASTDRTGEIATAYAKCDARIRYYRSEKKHGRRLERVPGIRTWYRQIFQVGGSR